MPKNNLIQIENLQLNQHFVWDGNVLSVMNREKVLTFDGENIKEFSGKLLYRWSDNILIGANGVKKYQFSNNIISHYSGKQIYSYVDGQVNQISGPPTLIHAKKSDRSHSNFDTRSGKLSFSKIH